MSGNLNHTAEIDHTTHIMDAVIPNELSTAPEHCPIRYNGLTIKWCNSSIPIWWIGLGINLFLFKLFFVVELQGFIIYELMKYLTKFSNTVFAVQSFTLD